MNSQPKQQTGTHPEGRQADSHGQKALQHRLPEQHPCQLHGENAAVHARTHGFREPGCHERERGCADAKAEGVDAERWGGQTMSAT